MGIIKNIKERKVVKAKAIKEAEGIFMKLNPKMAMKDGTFPKVTKSNAGSKYGKEAMRTQGQVVRTRLKQMRKARVK